MSDLNEREIIDQVGAHIAKSFMKQFGANVDAGMFGRYDDEDTSSRETPIRAIMVQFEGDFDDCLFALSSVHEDSLEPAMHEAMKAVETAYGAEDSTYTLETHVFEDRETAVEELEALYSLPTLNVHTPKGDVLIIASPEFLASVERTERESKLRRQRPPMSATGGTRQPVDVKSFEVTDPEVAALLGIEPTRANRPAPTPAPTPAPAAQAPAAPAGGAAAFNVTDPEVAALLGIDVGGATSTPAPAAPSATHAANAAAAAALPPVERWSQLLSGVEVDVSADLGSTRMRLGDATGLSIDSVLTLDQYVDDPVNVYVNGALFATARLVVVDDEYGIEIINVLEGAMVPATTQLAA